MSRSGCQRLLAALRLTRPLRFFFVSLRFWRGKPRFPRGECAVRWPDPACGRMSLRVLPLPEASLNTPLHS